MELFINETKTKMGISLSEEKIVFLQKYQDMLQEWNQKINLTAIKTPEEIQIKHFLDSLYCSLVWKDTSEPRNLIDVGTGAGFPGIVLGIVFPKIQITLLESIGKKATFCKLVIETLGLSSIRVVNERAEVLAHNDDYREQYDITVARAVAPLITLSEYILPFTHKDGVAVAMKGANADIEIQQAQAAIAELGGIYTKQIEYTLPREHTPRSLILIHKDKATPSKFPREVGVPAKLPLN